MKDELSSLFPVIGALIILMGLYGVYMTTTASAVVDDKIAQAKEEARPADIELTTISYDCVDCFDIGAFRSGLKEHHINVVSERKVQYGTPEATELIAEYGITRLPALIATGETNKTSSFETAVQQVGYEKDDALVTKVTPPYYSIEEERVVGVVSAKLFEADCQKCTDLAPYIQALRQAGLTLQVETTQDDAQLDQYNVDKLPALILDKEASYYEGFSQVWSSLGDKVGESYVLRTLNPPYVERASGEVVGLVTFTMLDDESCEECYDPALHKQILARYGVAIGDEERVDISGARGQELLEEHRITKVPTIVLTGDVDAYPTFVNVWKQVGKVEEDTYVFTNLDALGNIPYKDLETDEIINKR